MIARQLVEQRENAPVVPVGVHTQPGQRQASGASFAARGQRGNCTAALLLFIADVHLHEAWYLAPRPIHRLASAPPGSAGRANGSHRQRHASSAYWIQLTHRCSSTGPLAQGGPSLALPAPFSRTRAGAAISARSLRRRGLADRHQVTSARSRLATRQASSGVLDRTEQGAALSMRGAIARRCAFAKLVLREVSPLPCCGCCRTRATMPPRSGDRPAAAAPASCSPLPSRARAPGRTLARARRLAQARGIWQLRGPAAEARAWRRRRLWGAASPCRARLLSSLPRRPGELASAVRRGADSILLSPSLPRVRTRVRHARPLPFAAGRRAGAGDRARRHDRGARAAVRWPRWAAIGLTRLNPYGAHRGGAHADS